ncbi:hypothetical protein AMTRI_Chr09g18140 [Amborella trichopoda]
MKKLREQFLPFNYTQKMFQQLHTLRQVGQSVDDYTEEFYQLQQVARYVAGLRQLVQDVLSLYYLWTVSEVYQQALAVEKQQSRSRDRDSQTTIVDSSIRTGQFQDRSVRPKDAPSGGHRGVTTAPVNHPNIADPGAKVQGSSSTLRYFMCREVGHKARDCRKSNSRPDKSKQLLIVDENLDDADRYDGDPIYDEDDLVYGDVRETLVIQKSLVTPKQETQNNWLRTNIFHTNYTIGAKVCKFIIDSGSCENVISQNVVTKLKLGTDKHP